SVIRRAGPIAVAALLLLAGAGAFLLLRSEEGDATATDWGPLRLGVDSGGLAETLTEGGAPGYSTVWAGRWSVADDFREIRKAIEAAQARNVTPVVQWYYWGGDLTRQNVEHGANGKSRDEWFATADRLARVIADATGNRATFVVLETEFNHPDMVGWAPFDEALAAQARLFRAASPHVRIVLGFGSWNPEGWTTFQKAVEASDLLGFQLMRSVERDTPLGLRSAHLAALDAAKNLHDRWPRKPLLLHDLALSTYGHTSGEALQKEAIDRILAERETLRALGCIGILYRGVRDYPDAPEGYYGEGEKHFGLKLADGTPKPAWDSWLKGLRQNR
ncbi:MAG TPA: hypothetical protein VNZ52_11100, partial [Candidatus Thermoplasmatota archaeon]|nr:hypothetical protein [Candidatus Thermoplasmatota archaeon]